MSLLYNINLDKSVNMYIAGDKCPYLCFKNWKNDRVLATFSTRLGGISSDYYSSMNLGFKNGDNIDNVIKNLDIISNEMNIDSKKIILANQTHTNNVRYIDKKALIGFDISKSNLTDIDGLITDDENIVLSATFADCVPVYVFDKKNNVISLLHAGWRGSQSNIVKNCLDMITDDRSKVEICIGPSISQKNYEVSEDVAKMFMDLYERDDINKIIYRNEKGGYMLDLWSVNKLNSMYAGIDERNIIVSNLCTFDRPDLFFSHRFSNGKRGNMMAFMKLK